MTNEQINAAIAKACGWEDITESVAPAEFQRRATGMLRDHGNRTPTKQIPNYCNDLNAMHEAEKVLKGYEQIATYVWHLENRSEDWSTDEHMMATHATARQRAEAFLKTLERWEE
jgi:hypothetical protein